MFFKRKKFFHNLTKLYVYSYGEEKLKLHDILRTTIKDFEKEPSYYSVNYKKEKSYKSIDELINKINVDDFETLLMYADDDSMLLTISKTFMHLKMSTQLYEILLVKPYDRDFQSECSLISKYMNLCRIAYGYGRHLDTDHDPITETKKKQSWFRKSYIVPEDSLWLIHPRELETGIAKGIYPFNFWTKEAYSKLSSLYSELDSRDDESDNIVIYSEIEQQKILQANTEHKDHIRFF
ncbi:MAG: hypothetical protein OEY19_12530 [Gammaproteobacteria bacterium]|nr:hypothetical protein [Gammaproteobacteria bacterium]